MKKFNFKRSSKEIFRYLKKMKQGDIVYCPFSMLYLKHMGDKMFFKFEKSKLRETYKKFILKKVYDACQKIDLDLSFQTVTVKGEKIIVEEFKINIE